MPEERPQTWQEMMAAMWILAARMPGEIRIETKANRLGVDRSGESLEGLVVPLVFLQVHGGAAQVRGRIELFRLALEEARRARVTVKDGADLEDALARNLLHLHQNILPGAIAAEKAFHQHGFSVEEDGRIVEIPNGRRGRRPELIAVAVRHAREKLVKAGVLSKTSRASADVCEKIREALPVFRPQDLTDERIKGALIGALYPQRHKDVSK